MYTHLYMSIKLEQQMRQISVNPNVSSQRFLFECIRGRQEVIFSWAARWKQKFVLFEEIAQTSSLLLCTNPSEKRQHV